MGSIVEKGTSVWFPHEDEGWIPAVVIDRQIDRENLTLEIEFKNGEKRLIQTTKSDLQSGQRANLPQLMNPTTSATGEDLSNLPHLNEPAGLSHGIAVVHSHS